MRAPNLLALFFSFSLVFVTAHAGTITYTVNSEADEIDDDVTDGICHTASGVCTLRAAVMQAVGKGMTTTYINLPAGHYTLLRPVLNDDDGTEGDLNITGTNPIIIAGAGQDTTTIDANSRDRVFHVAKESSLTVYYVTLTGGQAYQGGAIWNEGTTSIYADTIVGNTTTDEGGALDNDTAGIMGVGEVTISNNLAGAGGAISNRNQLYIINTTIDGNQADEIGGGIINWSGYLTITSSTISNNSAGNRGGGIYCVDTMYLVNVTLAGNASGEEGGGIFSDNTPGTHVGAAFNMTMVDNMTYDGGTAGAHLGAGLFEASGGSFNIYNSLFARNMEYGGYTDDCSGAIVYTIGDNLFGSVLEYCKLTASSGGKADYLNDNTLIGALADNGGYVKTIALLPGSNAIDAGLNGCIDTSGNPQRQDARGFRRPVGAACDVGSYEYDDSIFADGFDAP